MCQSNNDIVSFAKYIMCIVINLVPEAPTANFAIAKYGKVVYKFNQPGLYVACVKYSHYIQCTPSALIDVRVADFTASESGSG